jgi:glycerate-2-kinase
MPDLRAEAVRIFLETLKRIDVARLIPERIRVSGDLLHAGADQIDLSAFKEIVLVGLGKASVQMGAAMAALLGNRLSRGVVVSSRRWPVTLPRCVQTVVGGHPLPDNGSLEAAALILDEVRACTDQSLIIFLVSGGGSALAELPVSDRLSLADIQTVNRLLVGSGATIREINTVRKALSRTKGGKLGFLARKTRTVAVYLSDVGPGDLYTLASNPLLPEPDALPEVQRILQEYGLADKLPPVVLETLERLTDEARTEWRYESGLTSVLIGDSRMALQAAADVARSRGWQVEVCENLLEDHYRSVAEGMAERLSKARALGRGGRICVISVGEALCPVRGEGAGGRNQEFVLYSAASLAASGVGSASAALSAGTDGVDGNSVAAGAVGRIAAEGWKTRDPAAWFADSDSSTFFSEAGGLIVSGPTGNNLRDIRIMLAV